MSAIPLEDAIERASVPRARSKLPPKALAYFCVVGGRRDRRDGAVPRRSSTGHGQTGSSSRSSRRASPSRSSSSCGRREQGVPHDRRLPDRGGPAAAAGAARADPADPARSGMAPQPRHLVRAVDQHLRVHDRDDGGVGGGAPDPRRRRACSRATTFALRSPARGASVVLVVLNSALLAPMIRFGQRPPDAPALLVPDALDGVRLRGTRRRRSPRSGPAIRGSSRSRSPRCC